MRRLLPYVFVLLAATANALPTFIQQSTATYHLSFCMVDSTDHVTPKTGLSPTVVCSKNAAGFNSASGAVTEIANGCYKLAGNATDSGTLGALLCHATASGADPRDFGATVVAWDPIGSANLSADAKAINGVATTSVTTVNANVGTTQPVNFHGTGSSAYVKGDLTEISESSVSTSSAQLGVNAVNIGGAAAASATIGTVTTATTCSALTTNNDKTGYSLSQAFPANFADLSITASTGRVTVGTNADKTGYALTSAYDPAKTAAQAGDAMALTSGERTTLVATNWAALIAGFGTSGSVGKLLADNLDATVSSRSTYAGADTSGTTTLLSRIGAPAGASVSADIAAVKSDTASIFSAVSALSIPTAAQIAARVFEESTSGHNTSGTYGRAFNFHMAGSR